MYLKEHNLGVVQRIVGKVARTLVSLASSVSLQRLAAYLPGLVCPYRQVGLCTVITETYPLLVFLISDALEEIQVLNVDVPSSQFHDPLVLESPESTGYGHPSGSYDGSQLLVGVGVGYD
jgi:hypothetical protein